MFAELHIIQNLPPSCINRGESNEPKDGWFGGAKRARVSSQAWKHAMVEAMVGVDLGLRTKRAADDLARRLVEMGHDAEPARLIARAALEAAGFGFPAQSKDAKRELKRPNDTKTLQFFGVDELERMARICHQHWDLLYEAAAAPGGKTKARPELREVKAAMMEVLTSGSSAINLALFGRMVADVSAARVDGAVQVAHAISTHPTTTEFDFYTAMDDLASADDPGAGMMGNVEFVSACFYRYLALDLRQLAHNLRDDRPRIEMALRAWLETAVTAIPSGRQRSMSAQAQPSLAVIVCRERGLWSMCNAFARPVRASEADGDLIRASAQRLDKEWQEHVAMYGQRDIVDVYAMGRQALELPQLAPKRLSLPAAMTAVADWASQSPA